MSKQLVCQYLEKVSREALDRYQHLIKGYIKQRHGIYALYSKSKLYYVGLASNLRSRLKHHLRDRHADSWDRFSVYLTLNDGHMKELESLFLRIYKPKGNKQKGKFYRAENIKKRFRKNVLEFDKIQVGKMFGDPVQKERIQTEIASQGREPALKKYAKGGFRIRMIYKGIKYVAKVRRNGRISFNGKMFNSPSLAAAMIIKRAANGWNWWKFQRSPGEWVRLDELRK